MASVALKNHLCPFHFIPALPAEPSTTAQRAIEPRVRPCTTVPEPFQTRPVSLEIAFSSSANRQILGTIIRPSASSKMPNDRSCSITHTRGYWLPETGPVRSTPRSPLEIPTSPGRSKRRRRRFLKLHCVSSTQDGTLSRRRG